MLKGIRMLRISNERVSDVVEELVKQGKTCFNYCGVVDDSDIILGLSKQNVTNITILVSSFSTILGSRIREHRPDSIEVLYIGPKATVDDSMKEWIHCQLYPSMCLEFKGDIEDMLNKAIFVSKIGAKI